MQRQLSESAGNSTSAEISAVAFTYRCLLRPLRLMWQVSVLPSKIGETLGSLYKYAQDSLDSFLCAASGKARRKERDGDQTANDTKLYLEESVLERKLPEADLKALVDLPAGLDYNEWLASHTLALFEHVNLVYGTVSEFCTPSGCADMIGPGNRTYLWFDEKGKKTRVAAPQYIDYVMTFTQKTVSDESIFPTKYANEFPSSFESIARKILRLQFHVIAHLYAAHFREIALLGLHTHLNLTFAHLTALHRRFNLIDEKETDVLRDLELALRLTDDNSGNNTSCNSSLNTAVSLNSAITTNTIAATTTNSGSGSNNASSSCNSQGNVCNTINKNNNNNNNNCNNHNYQQINLQQQQQQQQTPNKTYNNCATAVQTDHATLSESAEQATSVITATKINETITTAVAANRQMWTADNIIATTLIDGDASVPPICAQPETANKLQQQQQQQQTNTIHSDIMGDRNGFYDTQPTQYMQSNHEHHKQTQKALDLVHTRLIQCNVVTAPNAIAVSPTAAATTTTTESCTPDGKRS